MKSKKQKITDKQNKSKTNSHIQRTDKWLPEVKWVRRDEQMGEGQLNGDGWQLDCGADHFVQSVGVEL